MDNNYSEIVRQAVRAANAHNSQPWALREQGGDLVLRRDRERSLGPSDPSDRDTMLSLRSFVETLLICASSAGVGLRFAYDSDTDTDTDRVGRFERAPELYETPFGSGDVMSRRVWRGRWLNGAPRWIFCATRRSRSPSRGGLVEMPTKDARPLLVRANRWFFTDTAIVTELHRWARLSPRHPDYGHDGLNNVMLVLSRVERALLRALIYPTTYRLLRQFGLPELLSRMSTAATRGSGLALGIIEPAGVEHELEAGGLLMRLWLRLRQRGFYVIPRACCSTAPRRVQSSRHGGR